MTVPINGIKKATIEATKSAPGSSANQRAIGVGRYADDIQLPEISIADRELARYPEIFTKGYFSM